MTAQPAGTTRSFPQWLLLLFSGARFAFAAAIGCLLSAVFYAATCFALYFVLLGIAIVANKGLGSPVAWIFWPIVFFFIGLGLALIVYTPITLLTSLLARGRMWVWPIAPLLVVIMTFGLGFLLSVQIEEPNPFDRILIRLCVGLVFPYFFAGGYCLYWLVVFTLCQLGPWLVGKLKKG